MKLSAKKFTINDKAKCGIPVAKTETSLPRKMFQGEKEPGYLITPETISPWYWEGITTIKGTRYLYSDIDKLQPLSTLAENSAASAGTRIQRLVFVYKMLNKFLSEMEISISLQLTRPLLSIWLIPNRGILILPVTVVQFMEQSLSTEEENRYKRDWVKPGLSDNKAFSYQLVSLLYGALTEKAPLKEQIIRDSGYHPIPAEYLNPGITLECSEVINNWLEGKTEYPALQEMVEWIESNKECLTKHADTKAAEKAEAQKEEYLRLIQKKARRSLFFRKKGTMLIIGAALLLFIVIGGSTAIYRSLQPPITEGWPPEKVVEYYYQLQNDLNMNEFDTVLSKSVKNSRENQMVYLYVTNAVRTAYGSQQGLLKAQDWLDQGRPKLEQYSLVYGITDLEIKKTGPNTFTAEYILWYPDPELADNGASANQEKPDQTAQTEKFEVPASTRFAEELKLKKVNNHYIIDSIEEISAEPLDK